MFPPQEYSLNFYLRQSWMDGRLAYDTIDPTVSTMKFGNDEIDQIWKPDVFFRNEKGAHFHDITIPNQLLRVNSSGQVWYVTK